MRYWSLNCDELYLAYLSGYFDVIEVNSTFYLIPTADVLIKLLDMDSIEEGDAPDEWRQPDVVIDNPQDFEAYTGGDHTSQQ